MIKLYYVRGINRTDTPYFNTLVEQENYFNEKLISSIDAIYPPHYQNTIQFSNEDLDFNTQCNYISLDFNGKTYYYFIDDMEYLAEDLIKITITMDTFQTYMFNIIYHNATIERETIRRWNNDGTINRKYIREKFGTDIFERIEYRNISEEDEPDFYYLLGYYYDSDMNYDNYDFPNEFPISTEIVYNNQTIKDGSQLILVPIPYNDILSSDGGSSYIQFDVTGNNTDVVKSGSAILNSYITNININLKSNEKVYSVCLLRDLPIYLDYEIETRNDNDKYYVIKWHQNTIWSGSRENNEYWKYGITLSDKTQTYAKTKVYEFNFEIPTQVTNNLPLFKYNYIPQLLDENYISFNFGERMGLTTFPLSKLVRPVVTLCRYIDLFTTTRYYWITDKLTYYNEDIYDDEYLTMKANDSREYVLLTTDAWRNYFAQNGGALALKTILGGMALL